MKKVDRRGTACVKYSPQAIENLCGSPDAKPFWVADMDFASPLSIQKDLQKASEHGVYGYPYFTNCEDSFLSWAQKRHNWAPAKEMVVTSPGVLFSLSAVTDILLRKNPNYSVIVPTPAYRPFRTLTENYKIKMLDWPLAYNKENARFSLNTEVLTKLATNTPEPKILILCSPQNPTGLVWSEEELTKIATICRDNGILVLSDEIHADLVYQGVKHIPFSVIGKTTNCNCVTFMAPSKTFNIAGEHYSVTIFNDEELCSEFKNRLSQLFITNPSLFSTTAALAGYNGGYDWLMELTQTLKSNATFIDSWLKANCPSVKMVVPSASFIAFLDCSSVKEHLPQDETLSHFFGTKANIALNDGLWFGPQYGSFVRFNFGTTQQDIEQALQSMASAVNSLGSEK